MSVIFHVQMTTDKAAPLKSSGAVGTSEFVEHVVERFRQLVEEAVPGATLVATVRVEERVTFEELNRDDVRGA